MSLRRSARPRSTRSRRAAGATTGRCCTPRTRCGTCRTSRSAPRSRPSFRCGGGSRPLLAFFLAMGVAAHALDELHGRPLRTRIPRRRADGARRGRARGRGRARRPRRDRGHAVDLGVDRRSGRSWWWPTTWSCSAARSTPTCGSRSRGARSRSLTAYFAQTGTLSVGRRRSPPRRARRSRPRSARSRPRSAGSGATSWRCTGTIDAGRRHHRAARRAAAPRRARDARCACSRSRCRCWPPR